MLPGVPKLLRGIATAAQHRHVGYFKEEFIRLGGRRFFERPSHEQLGLPLFLTVARSNGTEVLEWLAEHEHDYRLSDFTIYCASRVAGRQGNIAWFQFIFTHGYVIKPDLIRHRSLLSDVKSKKLLEFLKAAGYSYHSCFEAAENGDFETLREMSDRGSTLTPGCALAAVEHNRLDILIFLKDRGVSFTDFSLNQCAWRKAKGFTPIIDFLDSCNCEKSGAACERAAELGNFELLKTLHEERHYPWNEDATYAATASGHLECLKYLIEHGCPWTHSTLHAESVDSDEEAGTHNSRPCLAYLRSLGEPPESEEDDDDASFSY